MKLHDMKRPTRKQSTALEINHMREDPYPYGLRLTLEDPELSKVGVKVSDLKPGENVALFAEARINSLEDNKSLERGGRQSATMTITKLAVQPVEKSNRTTTVLRQMKEGPNK